MTQITILDEPMNGLPQTRIIHEHGKFFKQGFSPEGELGTKQKIRLSEAELWNLHKDRGIR